MSRSFSLHNLGSENPASSVDVIKWPGREEGEMEDSLGMGSNMSFKYLMACAFRVICFNVQRL